MARVRPGPAPLTSAAGGRLVVLSPHLDDAVLSLGAAIARWARRGTAVTVLTVLAGDPGSEVPAGDWDRLAGFRSAGEAIRVRRQEDRRACELLGATTAWLPFADDQYAAAPDAEIWEALAPSLSDAGTVLTPGFPLGHRDHARVTRMFLERGVETVRVGLYAEQPYAMWTGPPETPAVLGPSLREPLAWEAAPSDARDRVAKRRAVRTYASQLPLMARHPRLLPWKIARYERARGGESVAWISTTNLAR